jgi:hypothetical protein
MYVLSVAELAGVSAVFCLEQWQFCAVVCGTASCAQLLLSTVVHTQSIFTRGKGVVPSVSCWCSQAPCRMG